MQLRISLFGLPSAKWSQADAADAPVTSPRPVKLTRTVEALLVYLLVQRHSIHTRESLISVFWGEQADEQARGCLSTALWRLRRVLEPDTSLQGQILLTTQQGEVGILRSDRLWLDVEAFENAARPLLAQPAQTLTPAAAQQLRHVINMHSGPLLEGFYEDWALRERERLRAMHINSLMHLLLYCHHHAVHEEAIACAQAILEQDSLREDVHCALMRLYHESGQRTHALQHYERCRQLLWQELGIEPMPETQALYQTIAQNKVGVSPSVADARVGGPDQPVYQQLKCALSELDDLRHRLQGVLKHLEPRQKNA